MASSTTIDVVAIMRPKKGETQKLLDLIAEAAVHVQKNETDTQRYEIYSSMRTGKDGLDVVVVVERYKNKQALKVHGESDAFKAFQGKVQKADLLIKPMELHLLTQKGGFMRAKL